MKAVILDGFCANPGDLSWKKVSALCELTVYDRTAPEDVIERAKDAEIVIVNKGTLTMTVDTKEYDIPEGHGLFIPPLSSHTFHSKEPNLCHVFIFSDMLVPYFFEFSQKNFQKTIAL